MWIICVIVFLVNVMLLRLFIAALWSPVEKGLTWRLLFVMFIVVSLLSHVVSWVRCGTYFVSIPNLCRPSYFFLVRAAENKPCRP